MYILGISSYTHGTAACLLKDGAPAALVEEERLNGEKNTAKFPQNAIKAVLAIEGIGLCDVDCVTFYWNPWKEVFGNLGHFLRYFPESLELLKPQPNRLPPFTEKLARHLFLRREFQAHGLELRRSCAIRHVDHHLSHAASAFFASPFDEAAILTLDGRGESTTALWALGRGNRIESWKEQPVPHSLGHLYAAVTDYLGFKPFSDEWKVMGLSAYGTDALVGAFRDLIVLEPGGGFRLNLDYFLFHKRGAGRWLSDKFLGRFGPPRRDPDDYGQRFLDVAFALQRTVEAAALHAVSALHERAKTPNLCLAGGVALNCLMNQAIVERGPFRNVFIQPLAGDVGTTLGSALCHYHQTMGRPRRYVLKDVYLGPGFSEQELLAELEASGLKYRRSAGIEKEAAKLLSSGAVVGWFQGRMEAGPRALGNRSILADPRRSEIRDRINALVKKREWFRPLAPAVTWEAARDYFSIGGEYPFMTTTAAVRDDKKALLAAVTHRDGTARVQTVARDANPRFWRLLDEFGRLTGVPVLLNTSFNENEPIVCSPRQALDCFSRSSIDLLAIGDYIVEKGAAHSQ